jgi:hypothetical protein
MTANLIDRDASWESNSSLELLRFFVAESLKEFFDNESIGLSTNGRDIGTVDTLCNGKFKSS